MSLLPPSPNPLQIRRWWSIPLPPQLGPSLHSPYKQNKKYKMCWGHSQCVLHFLICRKGCLHCFWAGFFKHRSMGLPVYLKWPCKWESSFIHAVPVKQSVWKHGSRSKVRRQRVCFPLSGQKATQCNLCLQEARGRWWQQQAQAKGHAESAILSLYLRLWRVIVSQGQPTHEQSWERVTDPKSELSLESPSPMTRLMHKS